MTRGEVLTVAVLVVWACSVTAAFFVHPIIGFGCLTTVTAVVPFAYYRWDRTRGSHR